jgi:hypothetical protein
VAGHHHGNCLHGSSNWQIPCEAPLKRLEVQEHPVADRRTAHEYSQYSQVARCRPPFGDQDSFPRSSHMTRAKSEFCITELPSNIDYRCQPYQPCRDAGTTTMSSGYQPNGVVTNNNRQQPYACRFRELLSSTAVDQCSRYETVSTSLNRRPPNSLASHQAALQDLSNVHSSVQSSTGVKKYGGCRVPAYISSVGPAVTTTVELCHHECCHSDGKDSRPSWGNDSGKPTSGHDRLPTSHVTQRSGPGVAVGQVMGYHLTHIGGYPVSSPSRV